MTPKCPRKPRPLKFNGIEALWCGFDGRIHLSGWINAEEFPAFVAWIRRAAPWSQWHARRELARKLRKVRHG